MGIEAVIFDIGRVLIEWDPHRMFDAAIGRERRERLFAEVDLEGMNLSVDRGAPFFETVTALAARHPGWRDEILLWRDRWIEMARPEIPQSVRLQRALRAKGVPVYALTNFGNETLALASRYYPFLTEFEARFVSGELGTLKPEPEIYAAAEAGIGRPPETLFFIDDRPDNIAAAAARGWKTHLFEGPGGLAARLVAEGLLSEEEACP